MDTVKIHEVVERAMDWQPVGPITSLNAFDWACTFAFQDWEKMDRGARFDAGLSMLAFTLPESITEPAPPGTRPADKEGRGGDIPLWLDSQMEACQDRFRSLFQRITSGETPGRW